MRISVLPVVKVSVCFKKGVAYKKVEENEFVSVLLEEIKMMDEEKKEV